jgi:hypothetical protein
MMSNMTDVVNNVANAMLKTGAAHVDPDMYLAVMEMTEFSTEALIVAYTHLLENKAVATGFVTMSTPHRSIWLRIYLSKTTMCSCVLAGNFCLEGVDYRDVYFLHLPPPTLISFWVPFWLDIVHGRWLISTCPFGLLNRRVANSDSPFVLVIYGQKLYSDLLY